MIRTDILSYILHAVPRSAETTLYLAFPNKFGLGFDTRIGRINHYNFERCFLTRGTGDLKLRVLCNNGVCGRRTSVFGTYLHSRASPASYH